MTKIEVLGSKGLLGETLDVLQDAGVVHITEAPLEDAHGRVRLERPGPGTASADTVSDTAALERIAERLREMSAAAPRGLMDGEEARTAAAGVRDQLHGEDTAGLDDRSAALYEDFLTHQRALDASLGERQVLERYAPAFRALSSLIDSQPTAGPTTRPTPPADGMAQRAVVMDAGAREAMNGVADILDILTDREGALYRAPVEGGRVAVLLTYPERFDTRIARMLGDEGIEELQLPVAYREKNLMDAATEFELRLKAIPADIAKARQALEDWLTENAPRIKGMLAQVTGRLHQSRQTDRLAVSGRAFLLQGFVPREEYDELKVRLARDLRGRVSVSDLGIEHGQEAEVPTKLRNRGFFKDFQVLLALLPPAKYGTVDATMLIGIGFPFFFGLMLGDIMYGLFVVALAFALKATLGRANDMVRAGGTVLMACGISTILFGIFFGEFGGDMDLGLHYLVYDRHHDLGTALAVVLGIGFVHVQYGLALNMMKHFRHGHVRHGLAQVGFISALFGLLLLVLMDRGVAGTGMMTPMWMLLVTGILLFLYGEEGIMNKLMALLHVLSYAGNVFSYARLMAIGLASVMLAIVANRFLQAGDLLMFLVGGFAAVFFHALNFALGVFGPSIHSLRLHYVEFFGKFYEPQGTAFEPFRKVGGEEV